MGRCHSRPIARDDFSRYIIAWKLRASMKAEDVIKTLELVRQVSGLEQARLPHQPRLLSDNGSSYIAGDLADWLNDHGMTRTRGAPYHPQTQGKIERWRQTLKSRVGAFVNYYNNNRYHESLSNVTPADAHFRRVTAIIERRRKIKQLTIQNRRLLHRRQAA